MRRFTGVGSQATVAYLLRHTAHLQISVPQARQSIVDMATEKEKKR